MKIRCERHVLQEAFNVAAGIVPTKSPKPILQNVLLKTDKDGLTLFATDLEMSVRVHLDLVEVDHEGSALLPAKQTGALLREITDATISLESKDDRTTIESGGGSFVLLGEDPEQYPPEVVLEEGKRLVISAARFGSMLRKTIFAAAREETRYSINGVLLDVDSERIRLVATDGRRLALYYTNRDEGGEGVSHSVVPLRALQALSKAIPEDCKDDLEIRIGAHQIGFTLGNKVLLSQLLETQFPDYEAVIPKMAETSIEVSRDLLEKKVRQAAVLSSGDVRMILFKFTSSSLELSAESSGLGRADVVMDVDVKGVGGSVSFNPDYVLDALKVAEKDVIRIDMSDDSTPAKFSLGESFTYVLMPISGS